MPFDCFVQVDGIEGESTDDKHKKWIEVLSFGLGATQAVGTAVSTGGARSGERVDVQDFSITKVLDKSTPKLFLACCKGTHLKTVTVELCRATGDKQKYMEYKMEDVLITSYSDMGSSGGDLPTEQISFNYAKLTLTYTQTDHDTGKPAGNVTANWSQEENKGS